MSLRNTLPFATIPEWLLEADISDRAVRLYGLLVRHADQDGHAFPSRKRLSDRLKCSVDSVDRAIRELRDVGAVQVQPRRDEAGDRTSNDYLLRPGGRIPAATPLGTPAATVAAPVRQELEPLEREPSEREKTLPTPRKRDVIADALAVAEGSDPFEVPASRMRTLCVKANELRKVSPQVVPAEVTARAARWASHFGEATVTGPAIVTHWARLARPGHARSPRGETTLDRHARRLVEGVTDGDLARGRRPGDAAPRELPRVAG